MNSHCRKAVGDHRRLGVREYSLAGDSRASRAAVRSKPESCRRPLARRVDTGRLALGEHHPSPIGPTGAAQGAQLVA
jgi:hypothetical protein